MNTTEAHEERRKRGAEEIRNSDSPFLDSGVQISSRAKLHNLTPMLILILHQVDDLDNIWVVER